MPRQDFPAQGQAAHVRSAAAVGHGELEEAGAAIFLDQRPARCLRVGRFGVVNVLVAPALEPRRQLSVALFEERPGQEAAVRHQSPSNTGVCLLANAS